MNWDQLAIASLPEIIAWAEQQPWQPPMASCTQDAEWHAEGDVWTHTKLVLEQLPRLTEWPSLSRQEQAILTFAALFHDSAKPLTTEVDPQSGRVSSPKHAVRGEQLARITLRTLGCDVGAREHIARLVRYHGRPVFLLERESPANEVVRMSWLLNNQLLYLLALADSRGRHTESISRPEETLHYWKLFAEEIDCFTRPYPFATDHARFTYFRRRDSDLAYVPHDDFSCDVTMLAGIPGSGKDTWLSRQRENTPVVSLDDIRQELGVLPTDNQGQVAQLAQLRCREHLREGRSFCFNATNTIRQTRKRWIDLFADYRARIEIVYLEPNLDRVLSQNARREDPVPHNVIRKLADRSEPPTWHECHQLTILET